MAPPIVIAWDELNQFLGTLFSLFPSIVLDPSSETFKTKLITPWVDMSSEFCDSIHPKKPAFRKLKTNTIAQGGQGSIGPLLLQKSKVIASTISFSWSISWMPIFCECFVKQTLQPKSMNIQVQTKNNKVYLKSNPMIHEALMTAIIGHLANMEYGLSLPRFFGIYACDPLKHPKKNDKIVYTVIEKYNTTLYDLFGGNETNLENFHDIQFPSTNKFLSMMTHLVVQLFALKTKYNITNFDMHLRNVMIQYMISDGLETTYIQGEKLSELKYIEYIIPIFRRKKPIHIQVPNIGFLPKIIDWGFSRIDLSETIPVVLELDNHSIKQSGEEKDVNSYEYEGDIEYNFFMYNLLYHLKRMTYKTKSKNAAQWVIYIENICRETIPFFDENVDLLISNYDDWLMRYRDVGTTNDPNDILIRWVDLLLVEGYYDKESDKLILEGESKGTTNKTLTLDFTKAQNSFELFNEYALSLNQFMDTCILNHYPPMNYCEQARYDILRFDPRSTASDSLGHYILSKSSRLWKIYGQELKSNITIDLLEAQHEYQHTYKITLEPLQYPKLVLPKKEKLRFLESHRMVDFLSPSKELLGTPLPLVNLHLTFLPNDGSSRIYSSVGIDLWYGSKFLKKGLSMNGGYFIVDRNVTNPLTTYLTVKDIMTPIGYFYTEQTGGHTVLPTMPPYHKDFGVVMVDFQNKIHIYKYLDFLSHHQTQSRDILVYCCNKDQEFAAIKKDEEPYKVACFSIPEIAVNSKTFQPKTKLKYKTAFETGPILIWDGEIVFTRTKMMTDQFNMKDLVDEFPVGEPNWRLPSGLEIVSNPRKYPYYKIEKEEQDCYAYKNQIEEYAFYSDQRSSSSFHIHHVLCITYDNQVLSVLCEGRGFNSVGLDRPQLTSLISLFNVKHAISLDGGFSANILYTEKGVGKKYILSDPDKRELGMVLHISYL